MSADDPKEAAKAKILELVDEFRTCASESSSRKEVGEHLVEVLRECLAAHGATLWWPHRSWWTGQRELKPDYSSGKSLMSRRFANNVALKPVTDYTVIEDSDARVLRIGVPIVTNSNSRGVIEVLQRPGANSTRIRGYVRFIRETAKILSASKAFGRT